MSRRRHEATPEHRRQVLAMTGYGLRQEDVAKLLKIDPKTLRQYYRHELDTGVSAANVRVAESLFNMAVRDKVPSAAIFWMKARAGWRERDVHDLNIGLQSGSPPLLHLEATRAFSQQLQAERDADDAPPTIDAEPEDGEPRDLFAPAPE
jgi:hypothetical protein